MGRENASVPAGGRRRRSSQMPGCNGRDRVKVRQAGPTRNRRYRYIGEDGIERTCLRGRTLSLRVTDIPVGIVVVGHHPESPAGKPDAVKVARPVRRAGRRDRRAVTLARRSGPTPTRGVRRRNAHNTQADRQPERQPS